MTELKATMKRYENEKLRLEGHTFARYTLMPIAEELINIAKSEIDDGIYYRACDKRELDLIKSGVILRNSRNHRDNIAESGLSVSEHMSYAVFFGCEYCVEVRGNKIGRGSDGEPLIDPKTLQAIKVYRTGTKTFLAAESKRREAIKNAVKSLLVDVWDDLLEERY